MFLTGIEGEGMLYFMGAGLYCGAVVLLRKARKGRGRRLNVAAILIQFCTKMYIRKLFDNDT